MDQLVTSTSNIVVAGFFQDISSPRAVLFKEVATDDNAHTFACVLGTDPDPSEASVVLFKHRDEGRNELHGDFNATSLKVFVAKHSRPAVVEFGSLEAERIFEFGISSHCIVFAPKDAEHNERMEMVGYLSLFP